MPLNMSWFDSIGNSSWPSIIPRQLELVINYSTFFNYLVLSRDSLAMMVSDQTGQTYSLDVEVARKSADEREFAKLQSSRYFTIDSLFAVAGQYPA